MRLLAGLFLLCAALVSAGHAESPNPAEPAKVAKAKPKRLKWLRRICSSEVNLAMKLSAIGMEPASEAKR